MFARQVLLLLALLAAAALAAGTAYAGDGDRRPPREAKSKDYVAELTKADLAFLEARIKNWNQLPAQKKQIMARNWLRIRQLDPRQRQHFEERLRRMRAKGSDRSKRWARMHEHGGRMLVDRGLAHAARRQLGHEFEMRLRRSDISDHVFERSFGRLFWDKVRQAAFKDGQPVAPDALPQGLPEGLLRGYARAYARYAAAETAEQRKSATKRLGGFYGSIMSARLRRELARSDVKGTDAYVALAARKVRQTWPQEFAASLEDPEALLRSAENYEVGRSLRRLWRRDGKLTGAEAALLVKLVERWAVHNRKNEAAAGADADALIKRLLRAEFRVKPELLDAMPPRTEIEKRAAWYLGVGALQRYFGRHRGTLGGGGPRGRGMLMRKPPARPEGVSDADWRAFGQALKAAGRPFLRAQPEGVSDEGWTLIKAAMKKRLEGFGRRRSGR